MSSEPRVGSQRAGRGGIRTRSCHPYVREPLVTEPLVTKEMEWLDLVQYDATAVEADDLIVRIPSRHRR